MRMLRLRLNITYKFIAYLMFLSVIPLLVVGFGSYQIASRVLVEETNRFTRELLSDQVNYLELWLEQIESLIANLSSVEAITTVLDEQQGQVDVYDSLATQARISPSAVLPSHQRRSPPAP